jgi:hypothetical protein
MLSRLHVLFAPGPPMLVRGRKWLLYATLACFVIAGTYVILDDPLNLPHRRWWKRAAVGVALFPIVVLQPLWVYRTRHLSRLAKQTQGRLCAHCAYDVSTLDPAGTCPECGKAYDIARDAPLWNSFVESTPWGMETKSRLPKEPP